MTDKQQHQRAYLDQYQPVGPVESDLLDEMISTSWRMHRIWGVETTAIEREMNRISPELEAKYENLKEETRQGVVCHVGRGGGIVARFRVFHGWSALLNRLQEALVRVGRAYAPPKREPA